MHLKCVEKKKTLGRWLRHIWCFRDHYEQDKVFQQFYDLKVGLKKIIHPVSREILTNS